MIPKFKLARDFCISFEVIVMTNKQTHKPTNGDGPL